MAQRLRPTEPGSDLLDDAIGRLRAMKTTVGLVLARALEAAHSRFLVFGSTLATLAAKTEDLEKRDNISWPALDERLKVAEGEIKSLAFSTGELVGSSTSRRIEEIAALEKRIRSLELGQEAAAQWRSNMVAAIEKTQGRLDDELMRAGFSMRAEQANAQATRAILRAALAVLDPPISAREILGRPRNPPTIGGDTGT